MGKVVFDTNIIISAAISSGPCSKLMQEVEKGKFTLYISEDILLETERTLRKLDTGLSSRQIRIYLRKIKNIAIMINSPQILKVVKDDPDDDKILGCAVAAKAEYLITGDRHLLDIKRYKQIKIVGVKEFIETI